TDALTYFWEESTNGGGNWSTVLNGGIYSNATTSSLTLTGITIAMNGNLYRCNVSNSCGSDVSNSADLSVNSNPSIAEMSTSNPSSCGTSTGSIQVGGSGTGDISWTGSTSGSSNGVALPFTINSLGAGNFAITFVSALGCASNVLNSSLFDPGALVAPTISASGATTFCSGSTITLTSSESTGILWSTGETTPSIIVSNSGEYSVVYTDGGGCTVTSLTTAVTVNASPVAPLITASGATVICQGSNVTLTSSQVSGNTWSTTETTQNIVVTSAGDYTVQYTDGNGCISTNSLITSVTTVNSAILPLVEGFTAVTFPPTNWNTIDAGGPGDWLRSGTIGNAPSAGNSMQFDNFTNDNRGSDDEIRIEPLTFQSQTSVTMTFDVAYAQYNGTFTDGLEVLVSTDCGTTFSSVYLKNGTVLATDPDITSAYSPGTWRNETIDLSLYDGQESVIISFKNLAGYGNNIYIDNINITGILVCVEPDVPTLTSVPSVCDGEEATINISGNLNDASDWQVYAGSCGGTLVTNSNSGSVLVNPTGASTTYFIRGEGNCAALGNCGSITINVDPLDDASYSYTSSSYCVGDVNPSATISGLNGGSFSSTSGLIIDTSTGLIDLAGSTPGTYTVLYTTNGSCVNSSTQDITITAIPSAPVVSVVNNCGSTTLITSGSNLIWSTAETTPSINVSSSGTYTVTQSNNGCVSPNGSGIALPIAVPNAPVVSVVDDCGSSTLTTSGTNLMWSTAETTPSIIVTLGGTYTVNQIVNGCVSANGSETAAPIAIPSSPVVTVIDDCGSSTLTTSGTNLLWSTSETTTSIGVTIPGNYSVTQTVNGCTSLSGSTFVNPSPPIFITLAGSTGPTSCSDSDGTITINGSATGTIFWNGAMTGSALVSLPHTITGLTAGSYTITFDDGVCTSNLLAESIIDPTPPSAPIVIIVNNCGSSTLTTSGTNLLWSTGETTSSITVSSSGTYTVTQTIGGCTSINGSGVASPTAIPSAPLVTVENNCGSSTLTTSGTNLVWSTTETTPSITVNTAGSYTVNQTVAGCTSLQGTGVANPTAIPSTPVVTVVDNCGTSTLTATGTNLTWSTTETTSSITVSTGGSYTVTSTAAECTSLSGSGIANPIALPSAPVVTVFDNCGTSLLTTSGMNLVWSTTETTASITVGIGGSYTVTQTSGGCTSLSGAGLANPIALPSAPVVTVVDNCGTSTLTTSGTNLVWSTTETTPSITVGTGGSYTVTQTVSGCTSIEGTGLANPATIPSTPIVTVADNCGTSTLTAIGTNLVWSTTETTPSINVTSSGTYTVTQTIGVCTSSNGTGVANPTT
ncbi:hypothetical protein N9528_03270, partial [Crocinitomicaceae bacterium]|nr:hypothetical protein [Crocinitomicaceae bacterium]